MTDTRTLDDRNPTADPAEENAFFPSPYSLSQYTSDTTSFAGLSTDEKYKGGRWKVLVIAAGERYMLMKNGTFFSTGNHPVETLLPLHHIIQAGYSIDVATVSGEPGKFEWWAYPRKDRAVASTWAATAEKFKKPLSLAAVLQQGLDDYAAVFIPGGHAAMNVLPFDTDVQRTLDYFLANNRLIVTLCHGPAALVSGGIGRAKNPFAGYQITAFPDSLDRGANIDIGYLPGQMPWDLCATLSDNGIVVVNDDMTGATHRDRNLITGDSPLAADQLGKDAVAALLESFGS